jgi:Carboxypeptidase regulatory-like domain
MRPFPIVATFVLLLGALGAGYADRLPFLAVPIEGTVHDPTGAPVVSARVELRSADRVLVADRTDDAGRFVLNTDEPWSPDLRVRTQRLGYETAEVAVPNDFGPLEIVLSPAPLPLPGFDIVNNREICSEDPDQNARRLWEAAAQHHEGGLDTVGVASYTRARTDTLAANTTTGVGTEGTTPGQRASAPLLRLSWDRRVEREGYAFPVQRTDLARSYSSWGYPPLEADFASHFGTETFGDEQDFHIESQGANGWVLHFCGRQEKRPYLDGVLEIGPDSLIRRVEWRFHTPDPDEDAGGWARFPPTTAAGGPPPLLPSESVTWKTLPDGEVIRRAEWYEGWVIARGDSVPFLPQRMDAASVTGAPPTSR